MCNNSTNDSYTCVDMDHPLAGALSRVGLSILFSFIGFVGMTGNMLVILIVLKDRRMRKNSTNIFILNLALADFIIMVFGVPEIVQFMMNRGWILGVVLCKMNRYILVTALYTSVATLMSVCVERYIAIVHPLKAHIFCCRYRSLALVVCTWPLAGILALPTAIYNVLIKGDHISGSADMCVIILPDDHVTYFLIMKYLEMFFFYILPLVLQIYLYTVTIKRLFFGVRFHAGSRYMKQSSKRLQQNPDHTQTSDALRSRKNVVKMLIICVLIYFISYFPNQVHLLYNTLSPVPLAESWSFHVFVMIIGYLNSAANPVLYGIFSGKFRRCYKGILVNALCCNLPARFHPDGVVPCSSDKLSMYTSHGMSIRTACTDT